jgi:hypothetical protein
MPKAGAAMDNEPENLTDEDRVDCINAMPIERSCASIFVDWLDPRTIRLIGEPPEGVRRCIAALEPEAIGIAVVDLLWVRRHGAVLVRSKQK